MFLLTKASSLIDHGSGMLMLVIEPGILCGLVIPVLGMYGNGPGSPAKGSYIHFAFYFSVMQERFQMLLLLSFRVSVQ